MTAAGSFAPALLVFGGMAAAAAVAALLLPPPPVAEQLDTARVREECAAAG